MSAAMWKKVVCGKREGNPCTEMSHEGHLAAFAFLTPFVSQARMHPWPSHAACGYPVVRFTIFRAKCLDMGMTAVSKEPWGLPWWYLPRKFLQSAL